MRTAPTNAKGTMTAALSTFASSVATQSGLSAHPSPPPPSRKRSPMPIAVSAVDAGHTERRQH